MKLHPWPTRRHPETGRREALIDGVWRSRQRAWQVQQTRAGRCRDCGMSKTRAGVRCAICARKRAERYQAWKKRINADLITAIRFALNSANSRADIDAVLLKVLTNATTQATRDRAGKQAA